MKKLLILFSINFNCINPDPFLKLTIEEEEARKKILDDEEWDRKYEIEIDFEMQIEKICKSYVSENDLMSDENEKRHLIQKDQSNTFFGMKNSFQLQLLQTNSNKKILTNSETYPINNLDKTKSVNSEYKKQENQQQFSNKKQNLEEAPINFSSSLKHIKTDSHYLDQKIKSQAEINLYENSQKSNTNMKKNGIIALVIAAIIAICLITYYSI